MTNFIDHPEYSDDDRKEEIRRDALRLLKTVAWITCHYNDVVTRESFSEGGYRYEVTENRLMALKGKHWNAYEDWCKEVKMETLDIVEIIEEYIEPLYAFKYLAEKVKYPRKWFYLKKQIAMMEIESFQASIQYYDAYLAGDSILKDPALPIS